MKTARDWVFEASPEERDEREKVVNWALQFKQKHGQRAPDKQESTAVQRYAYQLIKREEGTGVGFWTIAWAVFTGQIMVGVLGGILYYLATH